MPGDRFLNPVLLRMSAIQFDADGTMKLNPAVV
jgi:hypothetical protein